MLDKFLSFTRDFFNLFYPNLCCTCEEQLVKQEKVICSKCLVDIPLTGFHHESENEMEKIFWGRVWIEKCSALYYYSKGSKYQKLIHKLKYHKRKDIGFELGKYYGNLLKSTGFETADCLVPVPLHYRKERRRGYNQSMQIAMGLSVSLGIPVENSVLFRVKESETQTRKSRKERWENVKDIFECTNPGHIKNKHLLLVDDVVTTGATLEACTAKLQETEGVKVSLLALAMAK